MSPRKTRDLKKGLLAKGFVDSNSHHEMFFLYVNEKKTSVRTRISHGESDYHDNLLAQMAKQTKLSISEFRNLIDCPLSKEDYVKLLIARGHVKLARKTTN